MNKIKQLILNLVNEVKLEEGSAEVQMVTVIVGGEEKEVEVGNPGIEDGAYDIKGDDVNVFVVSEGKGEIKPKEVVPSADPEEVKQDDVKEELSEGGEAEPSVDGVPEAEPEGDGAEKIKDLEAKVNALEALVNTLAEKIDGEIANGEELKKKCGEFSSMLSSMPSAKQSVKKTQFGIMSDMMRSFRG